MNSFNLFSFLVVLSLLSAKCHCSLFIADDTLWCGSGNKADTCDSLGELAETDKCCRTHDYCPYTFSTASPSYNGYSINNLLPLSHCDCELIFNECLSAEPYKKGSYFIKETYFVELAVKCFAYLPCSNSSSSHDNLWNMDRNRRTGQCHNGFKVTVFDSIEDYSEFMHAKPTLAQKEIIKHALETNVDAFMSDAKKGAKCLSTFPGEHLRIVDMFTREFLSKSEPAPEATTTTKTTTDENLSDKPSELDDLKSNYNYVKLFGHELNESLAMILLGSCLLIPAGVIAAYLFVQYVKKRLTRYTSVKLNSNRSEAQLI